MSFSRAIWAIIAVYGIHWVALAVDAYDRLPWWDIPMHFSGGFAVGMLGVALHSHMTDKHHSKGIHPAYHFLFIVGFVTLVALVWEYHEFFIDNTLGIWYGWAPTQPSIGDTMLDLFLGILGGALAAFSLRRHW